MRLCPQLLRAHIIINQLPHTNVGIALVLTSGVIHVVFPLAKPYHSIVCRCGMERDYQELSCWMTYMRNTYACSGGTFSHPQGKLMLGKGHAQQGIAREPGAVACIPPGSKARPPRLTILMCFHSRVININCSMRSCT